MESSMEEISFKYLEKKIIIRTNTKICDTSEELIKSPLFEKFLKNALHNLKIKNSSLLGIFQNNKTEKKQIQLLIDTFQYLTKLDSSNVKKIVKGSNAFFYDKELLNDFVEYLYNFWRSFDRFLICSSEIFQIEKKPYRVFNDTIEHLTHLVRKTYRDIQENITGKHPSIYRQVRAGAEIALIISNRHTFRPKGPYEKLVKIPLIRQILLYPPLILNPPMNKRTGKFVKIDTNPIGDIEFNIDEWVCYPAKVGDLLILIYIHEKFLELGLSLCNLFELADDEDLRRKPDGIYTFGVPGNVLDHMSHFPTVFYDDSEHELLVAAVPNRDEFGYFGYLKKMALTLHNIKMMKKGVWPFHGALVKICMQDNKEATLLIIGDTGAGKSETLEAFRVLGDEHIKEMVIIADDMGSIRLDERGLLKGYGSEIGAFVRLDDLQQGYAFGQIDRTIIMSPSQINARAVLPVTTYTNVIKGHPIDMVLYANNYEQIDEDHEIIEQFTSISRALRVFRDGTVMSKGTTTSQGLVHSYFANIFGPPQYKNLHEKIAKQYFASFFANQIFVGQLRTRLGIPGWETKGPEAAARELLRLIKHLK